MDLSSFLNVDAFRQKARDFLQQYPETERLELLFVDLNGVLRGKWLPASSLEKLAEGALRLPRSACFTDVWSEDVEAVGLTDTVGDPDAICIPITETLAPVPWASVPSAQLLLRMVDQQTMQWCDYSSREILRAQVDKLAAMDHYPVVATELEFYLLDNQLAVDGTPQTARTPSGARLVEGQQYNLEVLEQFRPVLDDILQVAVVQQLPVDTTIAECGPGQFEINLLHQKDALLAADQAVLLKRLVKHVAARHNLTATFMAKPFGEEMGNGMHVHASLEDSQGNNLFASENGRIHPKLANAVAGLLETMPDYQIVFAPHANSYRRFVPGFYAPVSPCWGYDHRAAAVRVPAIEGAGARLEHRVSGADTNPYLVVAAVLAGMLQGISSEADPGEALTMQSDLSLLQAMTPHWAISIAQWQASNFVAEAFGAEYQRVLAEVKISEQRRFATTVTALEYHSYLTNI